MKRVQMLKIKSKETLAHMKEINNKIDCMAQGTLFSNLMEKNLLNTHTHTHKRKRNPNIMTVSIQS